MDPQSPQREATDTHTDSSVVVDGWDMEDSGWWWCWEVIKEKESAHKQGLANNIQLTQHMQIDLAYGDVSHSVIRCANINTSLVPVHFLNYVRRGHVLVLACGRERDVREVRLILGGIFFIIRCCRAVVSVGPHLIMLWINIRPGQQQQQQNVPPQNHCRSNSSSSNSERSRIV